MSVYVAELLASDYHRFRERDATLPPTHAVWLKAATEQVQAARRRGVDARLYPISFDDFAQYVDTLGIHAFDAATRDHYAADMAAADATWR